MSHIHSFFLDPGNSYTNRPPVTEEVLIKKLKERISKITDETNSDFDPEYDDEEDWNEEELYPLRSHLFEVVLTNDQMNYLPEVLKEMKLMGFVRVNRFYNSNSGNVCNVFHLTTNQENLQDSEEIEF